ncbi:MAG: hypothetical protein JWO31_4190 [Phycisphaerales bacterium]|nr:hypothetical protein [Phycisphaerales bacterium]
MPAKEPTPVRPMLMSRIDISRDMSISTRNLDRLVADGRFPPADVVLGRRCLRWRAETVRVAIDRLADEGRKAAA